MKHKKLKRRSMELSMRLIAVAIGAMWALRLAWKLLNWVYLRPLKVERLLRQQGLKGTSYKLVFGDMIDFAKMPNEASSKPMRFSNDIIPYLDPVLTRSIRSHGENPFIWVGPTPLVTITQPHLIREVFSRIDEFHKVDLSLLNILTPGIIRLNGEKWVKHRKLINLGFYMENLKLLMPSFIASCNEMINDWEKMATSKSGSIDLDVYPPIVNMVRDIIAKATFSTSYKEGRHAFELVEEQTQAIHRTLQYLTIPGWRYIPTTENIRFNRIEKRIRNLAKGIIAKRRIEMERGDTTKNDLLSFLLRSNLTEEDLVDECKALYIGGQETTTTLLAYAVILLAKHTHWQTKAREEVLKAFGKATPDFDGLNRLKTVAMILNEVLRLYSPTPKTWRKVIGDTKLGDWCFPKGTYLNLPLIYSHHDPGHWGDDAAEFNPSRFSKGVSEATDEKFVFTPFALGPRVCVGQNLALIESKMALTMILQRFWFEPSPSYTHSPFMVISLRPQFGARVILHHL